MFFQLQCASRQVEMAAQSPHLFMRVRFALALSLGSGANLLLGGIFRRDEQKHITRQLTAETSARKGEIGRGGGGLIDYCFLCFRCLAQTVLNKIRFNLAILQNRYISIELFPAEIRRNIKSNLIHKIVLLIR